MSDMFKGLHYFEKIAPELVKTKTLIHTGDFNQNRTDAKVTSWNIVEKI
jgi:hypothetical protein